MSHLGLKRAEKSIENVNEFKQLYDEHKKNVFAMALSILRDFELAEDVLQEVFKKYFQYTQHKDVSNAKAWLISVVRNTALDLYRKKKRKFIGFDEGYFDRIPYLAEDPLERMVLSKYLELLDDVERQIVILKDISGLKHREIANVLETPLGTVIWKYRKALGYGYIVDDGKPGGVFLKSAGKRVDPIFSKNEVPGPLGEYVMVFAPVKERNGVILEV